MTRVSLIVLTVLCGLTLVANVGCMKCGEKLTETAMERAVEQATGRKAGIDVGSNVDLSGLPAYLQYPGAKVLGKFTISTGDGSGATYSFETPVAKDVVVAWYKTSLGGQSWKEAMTMDTGEATVLTYTSGDENSFVSVAVSTDEGKTNIGITYGQNKN